MSKILQSRPYGLQWRASPWFITLGIASPGTVDVYAEWPYLSHIVVGMGMCIGASTRNITTNLAVSRHYDRLFDIFHHHSCHALPFAGPRIFRYISACGISPLRLCAYRPSTRSHLFTVFNSHFDAQSSGVALCTGCIPLMASS